MRVTSSVFFDFDDEQASERIATHSELATLLQLSSVNAEQHQEVRREPGQNVPPRVQLCNRCQPRRQLRSELGQVVAEVVVDEPQEEREVECERRGRVQPTSRFVILRNAVAHVQSDIGDRAEHDLIKQGPIEGEIDQTTGDT